MAMRQKGRTTVENNVTARTEFRHASMSASWYDDWSSVHIGWLSKEHEPTDTDGPFYVVKSYNTPIAWFHNGMWTIPNAQYSVTTTNHQHIVRVVTNTD